MDVAERGCRLGWVQVVQGESVAEVGRDLKKKDVVASVDAFLQAAAGNPDSARMQPGFYGLRKHHLERMDLRTDGFRIETEIAIKAARMGLSTFDLPIEYRERVGQAKLRGLQDGYAIGQTILSMAPVFNPTFVFLLPGIVLWALGMTGLLASMGGSALVGRNPLRHDLGLFQHRVHQHVGAGGRPVGLDVLALVVADPVDAGGEHHRCRRNARHIAGVVAGAGNDVAMRIAKMLGRAAHRLDAFGVEGDRWVVEDLLQVAG